MNITVKRSLCFFLLFALILPFFLNSSVDAKEMKGQYNSVDLLQNAFYPAGPLVDTFSGSSGKFDFTVNSKNEFARVFVVVSAPVRPTSVRVNNYSGTYVRDIPGRGYLYEIKFGADIVLSGITITFSFSSSGTRKVAITGFYGFTLDQYIQDSYSIRYKYFAPYSSHDWQVLNGKMPDHFYFTNSYDNLGFYTSGYYSFYQLWFAIPYDCDYVTVEFTVPGMRYYNNDETQGHKSSEKLYPYSALYDTPVGSVSSSIGGRTYPVSILSCEARFNPNEYSMGSIKSPFSYTYVCTFDLRGLDTAFSVNSFFAVEFGCFPYVHNNNSSSTPTNYTLCYGVDANSCVFGNFNDDGSSSFDSFPVWLSRQFKLLQDAITRFNGDFNKFPSFFQQQINRIITAIEALDHKNDPSPQKDSFENNVGAMEDFEQSQFDSINSGSANAGGVVQNGIDGFSGALAFVSHYTTGIADGIKDYLIVFTLPIFIGIFMFACSRAPGITHAVRARKSNRGDANE